MQDSSQTHLSVLNRDEQCLLGAFGPSLRLPASAARRGRVPPSVDQSKGASGHPDLVVDKGFEAAWGLQDLKAPREGGVGPTGSQGASRGLRVSYWVSRRPKRTAWVLLDLKTPREGSVGPTGS